MVLAFTKVPGVHLARESNSELQEAYFRKLLKAKPTLFCEIGAREGSASLCVKRILPRTSVLAYEANPTIYDMFSKSLIDKGISYHNIAITNINKRCNIFMPTARSTVFENGKIADQYVVEPEDTGKTSLLLRTESASYRRFSVTGRTLDNVLRKYRSSRGKRGIALWIDVEGATDRVIAGATRILADTVLLMVEVENHRFWRSQLSFNALKRRLGKHGLRPVQRDNEYGNLQYNVVFERSANHNS